MRLPCSLWTRTGPWRTLRDLRSAPASLTSREVARRQVVYGASTLRRPSGRQWRRKLLSQFTQPLAILLMVAAALAWAGGRPTLSLTVIVIVIVVRNAGFAFFQERQAEQAVDALSCFLPPTTRVVRDGARCDIAAAHLVFGGVLVVTQGGVCADARLIEGTVQLDLSALTGSHCSRADRLTRLPSRGRCSRR